jgi:transcriptional regulator with XRE-family HTH domain
MFALVGETLRRVRKERGKTLEILGQEAGLGRGQLSRIENAHQEATLSTLEKILQSQGMSRREFFRRYDLVEGEQRALRAGAPGATEAETAAAAPSEPASVARVQSFFGGMQSFFQELLHGSEPVAQGQVQVGELMVLFQVVPRSQLPAGAAFSEPAPPPPAAPSSEKRPRRGRAGRPPSRRPRR